MSNRKGNSLWPGVSGAGAKPGSPPVRRWDWKGGVVHSALFWGCHQSVAAPAHAWWQFPTRSIFKRTMTVPQRAGSEPLPRARGSAPRTAAPRHGPTACQHHVTTCQHCPTTCQHRMPTLPRGAPMLPHGVPMLLHCTPLLHDNAAPLHTLNIKTKFTD